ncbi:MAG: hypothetical protein U0836_24120 [Pirellulales bacterium]
MIRKPFTILAGLLLGLALLPSATSADSGPEAVLAGLSEQGKYTFLLFYRDTGPATKALDQALANELARCTDRAGGARVAVTDPAAKSLVQKLGISRAPMPMVVALAPNGAITGMFAKKLTAEMVDGAFVTPGMMESMKALQEKKLVLIRVASRNAPEQLPAAVTSLGADPRYKGRVALVSIAVDDEQEQRFRKELELADDQIQGTVVALLAPPGVLVGKFSPNASVAEITAKLEAAGKCCDDPNCKHVKQGK